MCGAPSPHIYRWEGEEAARARPKGLAAGPRAPALMRLPFPCMKKGKGKRGEREGRGSPTPHFPFPPLFPSPPHRVGLYRGAPAPCGMVCSLSWPIRPISSLGCPKLLSGDPISTRYPPKHFRCPNTIVLYINLYLSTILRLLVMSVISSGTPNNIRSPNHITHIIKYHQQALSVRTLRVRELCRHD